MAKNRSGRLWYLGAALLLVSCSGDVYTTATSANSTNGNNGAFAENSAAPNTGGSIEAPPACGGQTIPIELKQNDEIPDLHLVVDKSGSMIGPISLFDFFRSKWSVMRDTLVKLVNTFAGKIRFGLTLYPSDESCGAGTIDVSMQSGSESSIKQKLGAIGFSDGWTPTHTSLDAVRSYLQTVPLGTGPRYVLLATDGIPNCGAEQDSETNAESVAAIKALGADGVETFVVGFGDIIFANPAVLDEMALAGGVPNTSGPNKFYPATSELELEDALFTIAAGIIPPPCTYALTEQPEDPERVTVSFDGQAEPRNLSNADGWNYSADGHEISFYGSSCDKLRSGKVKQVSFVFGCTGPVIK